MKITVLGAAGGIGQALSLLLKANLKNKTELALYDVSPAMLGIFADLDHIPTNVNLSAFIGNDINLALENSNIVVICAGIARMTNMKRSDLFNTNSEIIQNLTENIVKYCPNACICIITNPVNSLVPLVAEILKKHNVYQPKKLFGITKLDVFRAKRFVSQLKNVDPKTIDVKVIGGHSEQTILPLFSQVKGFSFTNDEILSLTEQVKNAGMKIVEAKDKKGSATLSMAQAAFSFVNSLILALQGEENIIECAYVEDNQYFADFFALPILLGKNGYEKVIELEKLSDFEKESINKFLPILKDEIKTGIIKLR